MNGNSRRKPANTPRPVPRPRSQPPAQKSRGSGRHTRAHVCAVQGQVRPTRPGPPKKATKGRTSAKVAQDRKATRRPPGQARTREGPRSAESAPAAATPEGNS